MTMAMLDLAVKLPVAETTMPGASAHPMQDGEGGLFGDLLQQLTGEGAKGQDGEDGETCPCDGPAPEAPTGGPGSNALALPMPQLQAALATALSALALERSGSGEDVAFGSVAGQDAARSEILTLSRLVARKAVEAGAGQAGEGSRIVADAIDMPGETPMLQAWLNGPYATAAPTIGAAEPSPMNLTVLGVATHFAPVAAAADRVMAGEAEEMAAMAGVALPRAEGEVARDAASKVDGAAGADVQASGTATVAMPVGGAEARWRGASDQGANQRETARDGGEAGAVEATDVAEPTLPGELPAGGATTVPARQIGDEVARVLASDAPRPALAHTETRSPVGKLKVLHIQLQPESLGTVTVRMEMKADVLELRIDAARADTAELIQRDRDVLTSLIRAAGYSADDASIRVTHGDPAMAVATAASAGDAQTGSSGNGSQTAGDRSAHSQGREGGERRGEQQRPSGTGRGHDGAAAGHDGRDVYL
jgi:chemotaxis protein MotD